MNQCKMDLIIIIGGYRIIHVRVRGNSNDSSLSKIDAMNEGQELGQTPGVKMVHDDNATIA